MGLDENTIVTEVLNATLEQMSNMVTGLNKDKCYDLALKTQQLMIHMSDYVDELDRFGYEEITWKQFASWGDDDCNS